MNHNIRKVLDAISILQDVTECQLEVTALSHKLKAMYEQGKEGLTGVPFIDACSDEELIASIVNHDERTDLYPHICPFTFNYLRNHRGKALRQADQLIRGKV